MNRRSALDHSQSRRGFALVLVLITVVLTSAIAVLFFSNVGRERRGTDLYSQENRARQLGDTAVNLVMGQINTATKEGTLSAPVSWASQPGMIRTYTTSGSLGNAYKLYSWDNLVEGAAAFDPNASTELPDATWSSLPALYTDLNQPVNGIYPIADPAIANDVMGGIATQTGSVTWDFASEFAIVQDSPAYQPTSNNKLPMPVKWLYILQSGSWVAATNPNGKKVTVPGASASNPIVGRIAFWTDDETSKVNINTAGEGAFWDTPKSGSLDDMQFAANPPTKGEFQRTPGHPATTSLSAVFPELSTQKSRWDSGGGYNGNYRTELQSIYDILPRIQWGNSGQGSQGGTYPIGTYNTAYDVDPAVLASSPIPGAITQDADRLYATANDFWFRPDRSSNTALSSRMTAQAFQQRQFLITANSRAPETTLFETPRVSLWPITWPWRSSYFYQFGGISIFRGRNGLPPKPALPTVLDPNTTPLSSDPWMTAQERLLAFCGTTNADAASENHYFFQRQNPDSPTYDWLSINRNQQIVKYLRDEFDEKIPGFGASLSSKWQSGNADWIALNCFDFCRSLINQYTLESIPTNPVGASPILNDIGYSYTGIADRSVDLNGQARNNYIEPNCYTVSPLRVSFNGNSYTTLGNYPKLDQVSVLFYATQRQEPQPPTSSTPPPHASPENDYYNPYNWKNLINSGTAYGGPGDYPVGNQTTSMKAVMLFHVSGLSAGVADYSPIFWIKVTGPSFTINGSPINLPSSGGRSVQWTGRLTATNMNQVFYPLFNKVISATKTFSNTATGAAAWPLISDAIPMDPAAVAFSFGGSKLTAEIYAPYSDDLDRDPTGDSNQLVSSQQIDFGQWTTSNPANPPLPVPMAPRWNVRDAANKPNLSAKTFVTAESRPINWAYTEVAPAIALPLATDLPNDVRRDSLTAPYTLPYVYIGTDKATGALALDSPVFENRVRTLNGRNNSVFLAEISGTDVSLGATDTPFIEGVPFITPFDTAISMVIDPDSGDDPRLPADSRTFKRIDRVLNTIQPDEVFRTTPATAGGPYYPRSTARAQYHQLGSPGSGGPLSTGYRKSQATFGNSNIPFATTGYYIQPAVGKLGWTSTATTAAMIGANLGASMHLDSSADWTTMPGIAMDGGTLVRPDQEYQALYVDYAETGYVQTPYFQRYGSSGSNSSKYFSPNRQVPSPVILGTLPSSMTTGWQTLAFSPNPAAGNTHPGLQSPPDHLLLDLFWMPVAEPYPISDPFSTAGKINLNYAIMPFPYIQRKTALDALLKSTWITALPESAATNYKSHYLSVQANLRSRYPVNVENTLKAFDAKFKTGDIFRSASQVCEMFLYPNDPANPGTPLVTWDSGNSAITSWWNGEKLTADNAREDPYNDIYSRVTTKSNTYTVHWKVQVLKKNPGSTQDVWTEGQDVVTSELRGSTLIERYIDPNATNIPDYATSADPGVPLLSQFYKWRVVARSYFRP